MIIITASDNTQTLSFTADRAYKIYELLPKLRLATFAIKNYQQEPAGNEILIGVKETLSEIYGELVRIATSLEEKE